MPEITEDTAEITFQWVLGDMRELEKNLIELSRSKLYYAITVASRVLAYALTFIVAFALLPNASVHTVILIALTASLSIWVSWGISVLSFRSLERMMASEPQKAGWNTVWLDRSGITWNTEISQDYTSWLAVSEVVERDGSLWFKTGPANGFYIPSRVFSSKADLAEVMQLISDLREDPILPRHIQDAATEFVKH